MDHEHTAPCGYCGCTGNPCTPECLAHQERAGRAGLVDRMQALSAAIGHVGQVVEEPRAQLALVALARDFHLLQAELGVGFTPVDTARANALLDRVEKRARATLATAGDD